MRTRDREHRRAKPNRAYRPPRTNTTPDDSAVNSNEDAPRVEARRAFTDLTNTDEVARGTPTHDPEAVVDAAEAAVVPAVVPAGKPKRKQRGCKLTLTGESGRALINLVGPYMADTLGRKAFKGWWKKKTKGSDRDAFYKYITGNTTRVKEDWSNRCGESQDAFPSQQKFYEWFDQEVLPEFKDEQSRRGRTGNNEFSEFIFEATQDGGWLEMPQHLTDVINNIDHTLEEGRKMKESAEASKNLRAGRYDAGKQLLETALTTTHAGKDAGEAGGSGDGDGDGDGDENASGDDNEHKKTTEKKKKKRKSTTPKSTPGDDMERRFGKFDDLFDARTKYLNAKTAKCLFEDTETVDRVQMAVEEANKALIEENKKTNDLLQKLLEKFS